MQNGKKIHEKEIEEWEEDRRARFYFEKRDFLWTIARFRAPMAIADAMSDSVRLPAGY